MESPKEGHSKMPTADGPLVSRSSGEMARTPSLRARYHEPTLTTPTGAREVPDSRGANGDAP